jgi:hypothetical protein
MNVTLIKFAPVFGIVMLSLFAPQVSVASEDDGIYESLADVNIGKVFFSPDKRQAIDRNRGNTSAAGNSGRAAKRKQNKDAAGYIVSSDGRARIYSNGDFILSKDATSVEFPGQVKVTRSDVADDAEAGNAND